MRRSTAGSGTSRPAPSCGSGSGTGPQRWPEFRRRYFAELRERPELVEEIRKAARAGPITLVYGARDEAHNDAVVLKELLTGASVQH